MRAPNYQVKQWGLTGKTEPHTWVFPTKRQAEHHFEQRTSEADTNGEAVTLSLIYRDDDGSEECLKVY